MKKYLIAGNWKMNTVLKRAEELVEQIKAGLPADLHQNVLVAVFPPSLFLKSVKDKAQETRVQVGAQNCSNEPYGAFTGETSTDMLQSVGCEYVLVGHSERRLLYKESNQIVAAKIQQVLTSTLTPILCIGETLKERQDLKTWDVLKQQLDAVYSVISGEDAKRIIIAYEPVWAIGTGIAATKEEAQEAHQFIRNHIKTYNEQVGFDTSILYGGSVTAENSDQLLQQPDIDGALIGGASLKAESFLQIISTANSLL